AAPATAAPATAAPATAAPATAAPAPAAPASDAPGTAAATAASTGAVRSAGRHRRPTPPHPALLALPRPLRGARVSAPSAALLGLALAVLAAALVFGVRVALTAAASAPEPVGRSTPSGSSPGSAVVPGPRGGSAGGLGASTAAAGEGPPTGGATGGRADAPAGTLVVHVVGQVRRPGVLTLPAGARVGDALAKAGGALRGADLGAVNLARPLTDGEQLRIPRPGEVLAGPPGPATEPGTGGGGSGVGGGPGPVNLNTATAAVLEELPGVGPVLAQRILDWRTEHGRFTSVDELAEVSGIGEKMFAQLQGKVTV
ncbi:MAG TPA: ComEA family DNA-binding protein, partial [Pedococcus sp.]